MSNLAFWLTFWLAIGFLGQAFFTARFWCSGWSRRRSAIRSCRWRSGGSACWGGQRLLSYAIFRRDPVIIIGQGMGLFVYARNLILVGKARRRTAAA